MASEKLIYTETFVAGEDLSGNQYYGVEMAADGDVELIDAITDKPVGVLLNEPESGQEAQVLIVGRCPVVTGEIITLPSLVRFGANGKAYMWDPGTDTTAYVAGTFKEAATEAGMVVEAIINCANPARGSC